MYVLIFRFFKAYEADMEIIRTICENSFFNPFFWLPVLPRETFLCWRGYFRDFNCVLSTKSDLSETLENN